MNVVDLGIIKYEDAITIQADYLNRRIVGSIGDTLLLLEHYPVITMGLVAKKSSIRKSENLREKGITLAEAARGGDATYHAPGQLVAYPIIDLKDKKKDIAFYIDFLEKTAERFLNELGVASGRVAGKRGVWSGGKKIAFTGVAFKKWVTYHGLAINVNNDLSPFSLIDVCGDSAIRVTSAAECFGKEIPMQEAKNTFRKCFKAVWAEEYEEVYA